MLFSGNNEIAIMMPSNQFMFLDQAGAPNPHQQSQSVQQAFLQPGPYNPYQSNILQQRLAEPTHSPSPPQPNHGLQYSTQSQLAVQSIMAPPSQSGITSQFFPQVGQQSHHQQQHFQMRQQPQFHYSQMSPVSAQNRMNPVQSGIHNSQNQNLLASLLTTRNSQSPGQYRNIQAVSSQNQGQFIQMPQMIRQPISTATDTSAQYDFMQNSDHATRNQNPGDFRQIQQPPPRLIPSAQASEFHISKQQNNFLQAALTKPNIEDEFRQPPVNKSVIPDEFLQAPVQKFGEQLEKDSDDVTGLIENIQNISSKSTNLDDSVQEVTDPKNDVDFDVDELVHELISEVDNTFVSNNNKELVELNDSTENHINMDSADMHRSSLITSSPKQIGEEVQVPVENDSNKGNDQDVTTNSVDNEPITLHEAARQVESITEEAQKLNACKSPNENIMERDESLEGNQSPHVPEESASMPEDETPHNGINDSVLEKNSAPSVEDESTPSIDKDYNNLEHKTILVQEEVQSSHHEEVESSNSIIEPQSNPSMETGEPIVDENVADPEAAESPMHILEDSNSELEIGPTNDTLLEEELPNIKPTFQLKLNKNIFFSDALDFSTQKNVTNMDDVEREALLDSLKFTKEMRDLTSPIPYTSHEDSEAKPPVPELRAAPFQNDQLNGILYGNLTTPPQFGRQYGFPNLSQPSNIHPILGSILTQQQTTRNVNLPPLLQSPQTSTNPFLHTNQLDFLYQNKLFGQQTSSTPSKSIKRKADHDLMGDLSKTPPVQRRRFPNSEKKEPLYVDTTLPPGWCRTISQRKTGASAGGWDTYIIHANGKRFRSRMEIKRYFEKTGETEYDWQDFDFNPFGSKGQQNPGQSYQSDGDMNGSLSLDQKSNGQAAQDGDDGSNSEMLEMEPDIQNFLSCELGQN